MQRTGVQHEGKEHGDIQWGTRYHRRLFGPFHFGTIPTEFRQPPAKHPICGLHQYHGGSRRQKYDCAGLRQRHLVPQRLQRRQNQLQFDDQRIRQVKGTGEKPGVGNRLRSGHYLLQQNQIEDQYGRLF